MAVDSFFSTAGVTMSGLAVTSIALRAASQWSSKDELTVNGVRGVGASPFGRSGDVAREAARERGMKSMGDAAEG